MSADSPGLREALTALVEKQRRLYGYVGNKTTVLVPLDELSEILDACPSVTDAMVERAAVAIFEHTEYQPKLLWAELAEHSKEQVRRDARAALAAALV